LIQSKQNAMNFTFVAAAIVFSSVATASVPAIAPVGPVLVPSAMAAALPVVVGVVEAIRRIEHGGTAPATFEFTVRLRDGSTRISSTASAFKWRSGDRIMLMGGATAPAASQL
jgi:hypothetical protein